MNRFLAILLAAALPAVAAASEPLTLLNEFTWNVDDKRFGGMSALHVSENGDKILTLSDRAHFFEATILRDGDRITGLSDPVIAPVRQIDGNPARKFNGDSEGLAVDSSGAIFVSFEGFHRIRKHKDIFSPAEFVKGPVSFKLLQTNSGLESLAIDANDTIYALPERSGAMDWPFPVFRRINGEWDGSFYIPRSKEFLPTGADVGPDGKFYLVERHLVMPTGFQTRIRRFSIMPTGFTDEEVLLETNAGRFDNLEGIDAWRDDQGRLRLTLVSDDNFFALQKTQIVEFVVNTP